jgi:hypothetical protein
LYFSSDWHHGFGGFDIFKSVGENTNFGTAENLGLPINSSINDLYFSYNYDNENGYFTSNREDFEKENSTCCTQLYYFELPKEKHDSLHVVQHKEIEKIKALKNLNDYLPITLYFHNDEPNPRTKDTLTTLDYIETYKSYVELTSKYQAEYSADLDSNKAKKAKQEIVGFYENHIDKGVEDLDLFTELLAPELEKGDALTLKIKGYASPLAKGDYNRNLTLRRISSLINHLHEYDEGNIKQYIDDKTLDFIKIPYGEVKSDGTVSDNFHDQKNSVYSIKAMKERKIEILAAEYSEAFKPNPEISFDTDFHDFGEVKKGEKVQYIFKFRNTGKQPLEIYNVESSCECTIPMLSKTTYEPDELGEIIVEYNAANKPTGIDKKEVLIFSNAYPKIWILKIKSKITE